jgi:hypothetical protein
MSSSAGAWPEPESGAAASGGNPRNNAGLATQVKKVAQHLAAQKLASMSIAALLTHLRGLVA